MHNLRSIWWMTRMNLFKWSRDLRILLILVLVGTLTHMHISGLISFVHNEHFTIHFALLPFWTESSYVKILFFLPIFILFADAPFIDNLQLFLIMRSNRRNWVSSQILYVMITSMSYVVCVAVFFGVFFIPHLEWGSDWGNVVNTLSKSNMGSQLGVIINFPRKIIDYFSPYQALFFSFILQSLVINLMGLIILLMNIWSSQRYLGLFIAASFLMLDVLIRSSGVLTWVSPVSWIRLTMININGELSHPNFYQIIFMLILLTIGLVYLIVKRIRRYEV